MSSSNAIEIRDLSKVFKIYENSVTGPIKERLFFWRKKSFYKEFVALSDISLTIKKGEVIGVMGPNGAGKTTLLKMIAGLLSVDRGSLIISGHVTAMLAQGSGFHEEFTGRENILYGGLMLGMKKKEILEKMEEIIEFADIGEHIDMPMRTYSTGMKARLIFATSTSIQPDIVIVDEALATGDGEFFQKSMGKVREIVASGATILFVSHNLRQIKELCARSIVLLNGHLAFDGSTSEAVDFYTRKITESQEQKLRGTAETTHYTKKTFQGTGEVEVVNANFLVDGKRTYSLRIGGPCSLILHLNSKKNLSNVAFYLGLRSEKSPVTYAFVPSCVPSLSPKLQAFDIAEGKSEFKIDFDNLLLGDGNYFCDITFYPKELDEDFNYDLSYCHYTSYIQFQAFYEDTKAFGRGTIAEVPIKSMQCKSVRNFTLPTELEILYR